MGARVVVRTVSAPEPVLIYLFTYSRTTPFFHCPCSLFVSSVTAALLLLRLPS